MTSDPLQRFSDGVVRLRPLDVADIALVDDDTSVGMVGIQSGMAYLAVGQVNITYGRYPPWRGRGLATRAVRLVIDLALELFRPTESRLC